MPVWRGAGGIAGRGHAAKRKIGNAVQSDLICTGNQQPVAQRVRAHGIFGLCHCSSLTYVSLIIA